MSQEMTFHAVDAGELPRHDVHVWWYDLDVCTGRLVSLERTLDDEERVRADRFRFDKHRRRFIAARGTLREIIARYVGAKPRALRFERGAHGKPRVINPDAVDDLEFNASDSHGIGAVALARGIALGIDLERISPDRDCELIASREFTAQERAWLCGVPETRRVTEFFELWTCKEAYLKGKGLGLTVSLDRFCVQLRPETAPRLAWSDIDHGDPQRWSLHRLAVASGFAATLAVEGGGCHLRQARWCP